jgi:hypothetical protein
MNNIIRTVWCWEESGEYPNTSTCTLPDGHYGPHEFTPDSEITIGFLADGKPGFLKGNEL